MTFRKFRRAVVLVAWLGVMTQASLAQTFPSRLLNLVVPFPAGGPSDYVARTVQPELAKQLGQQIIVENIGGAGGSIGIQKVGGLALPIFWATLEAMRDAGDTQGYYEDAFQRMMHAGVSFRTVPIGHHEWTEIDDLADLEDARARFAR